MKIWLLRILLLVESLSIDRVWKQSRTRSTGLLSGKEQNLQHFFTLIPVWSLNSWAITNIDTTNTGYFCCIIFTKKQWQIKIIIIKTVEHLFNVTTATLPISHDSFCFQRTPTINFIIMTRFLPQNCGRSFVTMNRGKLTADVTLLTNKMYSAAFPFVA